MLWLRLEIMIDDSRSKTRSAKKEQLNYQRRVMMLVLTDAGMLHRRCKGFDARGRRWMVFVMVAT